MNLLPKNEQKDIRYELLNHQLVNFWMWIVASLVVLYVLSFLTAAQLKRLSTKVEIDIAKNQEALNSAQNQELQKQVQVLNKEIKKINQLRSQHYAWSEALTELGNLVPSDMVIDILSLDRATGKAEVVGSATDRESIIRFWQDMHKSQYFKDINFPLSNLEAARNASLTFQFFINQEQIQQ